MNARPGGPIRVGEPIDIRLRIGARIRAAREDAGYSQAELARLMVAAGMPTATGMHVSRWERGEAMPRPESFAALERALGMLLC